MQALIPTHFANLAGKMFLNLPATSQNRDEKNYRQLPKRPERITSATIHRFRTKVDGTKEI